MKRALLIFILPAAILFLQACTSLSASCPPNTIIEWGDMLKINDIRYQHDLLDVPADLKVESGKKLGEVSYEMADDACTNHKMKNGDAAYLGKGTPIYEVHGYPSSLLVYAGGRIFLVDENQSAKTVGDKYPIAKAVKNVVFQSTYDGSVIHTFPEDSKEAFLQEWLSLELFDPMKLDDNRFSESEKVFIGIELENGVIFRETYWSEGNVFNLGANGTKVLQEIVKSELEKISNNSRNDSL